MVDITVGRLKEGWDLIRHLLVCGRGKGTVKGEEKRPATARKTGLFV